MQCGIFDTASGLVGEFAEVGLVLMRSAREHSDVGSSAKHCVFVGGDHNGQNRRVFKAQPLHRVR